MCGLSPLAMLRHFAKQRSLTLGQARSVFRAELLAGKHQPRGIRFVWRSRGRPLLVHRPASTIPGGWTYVAGLTGDRWEPALNPPDHEAIPSGFLLLAADEDGFDDAAALITAGGTQYRYVTYQPEDAVAALPIPTHASMVDKARRRAAVQSIKAAGKVPTSPDYPVSTFIEEVGLAYGLPVGTKIEEVPGFNRRTLQRVFKSLKN
jgi:hypothetical protein